MRLTLLPACIPALIGWSVAHAAAITFSFGGTVDNDPFGVFNDPFGSPATFTGSFTFDSAIPQVLDTPNSGGYADSGAAIDMRVQFAGTVDATVGGPYIADALNITVDNDFPGPLDQYLVTGSLSTDPFFSLELVLEDFSGTAFGSTALPLTPPNLAAFTSARLRLFTGSDIEVAGTLDFLVCTAGCSQRVPEPGTLVLLVAALLAMPALRRRLMRACGLLAALALAPIGAHAVDGVILIDQNRALAGNATPGDAPGFPVSINQPGSYRLSGNLVIPNANTSAIVINASHVTLDLNGFAILGPVDCSGGFPCANAGTAFAHGIVAGSDSPPRAFNNIVIRNGTISGMGADAIHILGDSVRIEEMRITDSTISGIVVRRPGGSSVPQLGLIVARNTLVRNAGSGIKVNGGSVTDNAITNTGVRGIWIDGEGGTVARNVVTYSGIGLLLGANTSYNGNTLFGNAVAQVVGGVNTGQNACSGAPCP